MNEFISLSFDLHADILDIHSDYEYQSKFKPQGIS